MSHDMPFQSGFTAVKEAVQAVAQSVLAVVDQLAVFDGINVVLRVGGYTWADGQGIRQILNGGVFVRPACFLHLSVSLLNLLGDVARTVRVITAGIHLGGSGQ